MASQERRRHSSTITPCHSRSFFILRCQKNEKETLKILLSGLLKKSTAPTPFPPQQFVRCTSASVRTPYLLPEGFDF